MPQPFARILGSATVAIAFAVTAPIAHAEPGARGPDRRPPVIQEPAGPVASSCTGRYSLMLIPKDASSCRNEILLGGAFTMGQFRAPAILQGKTYVTRVTLTGGPTFSLQRNGSTCVPKPAPDLQDGLLTLSGSPSGASVSVTGTLSVDGLGVELPVSVFNSSFNGLLMGGSVTVFDGNYDAIGYFGCGTN